MMNFLKKLFTRKRIRNTSTVNEELSFFPKLMAMLQLTQEEEYSCDQVYELLDEYAEAVSKGMDVDHLMPLIKHHLELCKDCHEEYEALLNVIQKMPQAS